MVLSIEEAYEILELPPGTPISTAIKSYKRLSIEWFPDKHDNSPKALEKFQNISQAILQLLLPQKNVCGSMTHIDMLSLFQQIFFGSGKHAFAYGENELWDDEAFSSDSDFLDDIAYSDNGSEHEDDDYSDGFERMISDKEATKNAEALIEEEEKEKKKTEKRRAKKKRRKEKKKLEKTPGKHDEEKNIEEPKTSSNLTTETRGK